MSSETRPEKSQNENPSDDSRNSKIKTIARIANGCFGYIVDVAESFNKKNHNRDSKLLEGEIKLPDVGSFKVTLHFHVRIKTSPSRKKS